MSAEIGLFLTNQQHLGADLPLAVEDQLRLLRAARDNGWDSVWAGQHYLTEGMAMLQPAPFLGRLAAEAGQLTVGIGIALVALLNPVHVAETYASLDVLTGGRLVFGAGLGYRDVEYDAFGIPRGERVRRFEENLRLILRLWTERDVHSDLPWCTLRGATLGVRPVQEPRPPVWIAANADAAVRRAARLGDAWLVNPHAGRDTIARQLGLFRDERTGAGLAPATDVPAMREIYCAPSRDAAVEVVRPFLERKYRAYADWGQDRALPGNDSFRVPFEELVRDRFVLGSPDDCLEELLPWRDDLGVTHFVFRTDWVGMPAAHALSSIDLLSREVIPVLRGA